MFHNQVFQNRLKYLIKELQSLRVGREDAYQLIYEEIELRDLDEDDDMQPTDALNLIKAENQALSDIA